MAAKDRYNNNLRRGDRVSDLRADSRQEGEVVGTDGRAVLVQWDGGQEERLRGADLVLASKRFR
jgi:hypothetical protein